MKTSGLMIRYLTQLFFISLSIVSAVALQRLLSSNDFNGTTLIPLGIASLNLQYTLNTGVNFGLAGEATQSRQFILSALAIVISLSIIIWGSRSMHRWAAAASGLCAGGGLANAYERIAYGGVFDYLNFNTNIFQNPFSFNLADIYIFLGLLLFIFAPRETHDPPDGPTQYSNLKFLIKHTWNFGLTLALLVSCLHASWQLLSKADFLYSHIYNQNNLEVHVNKYAPQNRNKVNFELTTREERVRVFNDIAHAINNHGKGLAEISYTYSTATDATTFLVEAEREHLQDVANLVSNLKPIGAFLTSLLLLYYIFCWYYKVTRYQYFWRPYGIIITVTQISTISLLCMVAIFIIGPQTVFYLLHELAFTDNSQWFFYYQDSLMTTLMPEIVFANIAILLFGSTVILWITINLILQRILN